jgi:spore germination cell wall hydrolase CwlJ-like protein
MVQKHTQAVAVQTKEDNDMSIIRRAVCALVVLSVLAFQSVSRAETQGLEGQPGIAGAVVKSATDRLGSFATALVTPVVDLKELQCLARNIFFEAANEPEEGKVAVGLVTLNRVQDERFPKSVCGVVDQKTIRSVPKEVVVEKQTTFRTVYEPKTIQVKTAVCQFSWRCMNVKTPRGDDERWLDAQRIARELLSSDYAYEDFRAKYDSALFFHATYVRPAWARQKEYVGRIGGHHFYGDTKTASVRF